MSKEIKKYKTRLLSDDPVWDDAFASDDEAMAIAINGRQGSFVRFRYYIIFSRLGGP